MNFDRRCQRIYQIGCLACRKRGWFNECQVHHQNLDEHAGQVRLGNEHTIGLCPWHHVGEPLGGAHDRQWCRKVLGPSMKLEPVAFRQTFGDDESLLAEQNRLIDAHECAISRGRQPISVLTPLPEAQTTHD